MEPFAIAMCDRSYRGAKALVHPDVLGANLADLYLVGLHGGYRQSEFTQKSEFAKLLGKCEMAPHSH